MRITEYTEEFQPASTVVVGQIFPNFESVTNAVELIRLVFIILKYIQNHTYILFNCFVWRGPYFTHCL